MSSTPSSTVLALSRRPRMWPVTRGGASRAGRWRSRWVKMWWMGSLRKNVPFFLPFFDGFFPVFEEVWVYGEYGGYGEYLDVSGTGFNYPVVRSDGGSEGCPYSREIGS